METYFLILGLVIATCNFVAFASDPSPLQDFCVALPGALEFAHDSRIAKLFSLSNHPLLLNGFLCKNPKLVEANDFSFSGLHTPGNTNNSVGSKVTPVTVSQIPGINTFGISMVRLDFAPWGVNPPHAHPRATEILTVLSGSLEVGFVTSNPENRLITKTLERGDVFVFPEGLIHFQRNVGNSNATALAGLSSQNPGVITMANSVFGSDSEIPDDILAKAFQVDVKTVDLIQSKF